LSQPVEAWERDGPVRKPFNGLASVRAWVRHFQALPLRFRLWGYLFLVCMGVYLFADVAAHACGGG
jgi:hypothetical protein